MGNNEIKVGIADLNLVLDPGIIMTIGLGSCIGIALYDRSLKVAGLSHIMLPDSTQFKNASNPMKFADSAIPMLINKMYKQGCKKQNIIAKIAGGASMFNFSDKSIISDIGKRNSEAVKKVLKDLSIPIIAEDTGGDKGRTMILEASTGKVTLKIVGKGMIEL
ncbi:chemotaxis protein CheD [Clostridium butyricum]|uniref:Probable chemoreceptor glutamine deamidase CheD n=1 Tax=Clostridium butyricum E4 str. BoNT E BL5262 TaxID=632245 RepID=C4IDR5_CLOBU|nr:chemotaxis protein CheD [Clostridium butyricum]APF23646.1 cheD chemotactic sensory transduction family protein [Clostridium butyricum]EDT75360.1 chemoreceptor glutamine deamidase CheD [Clostridium butyricum 5521]EEP55700.1 chemoreceptor glutamine deamidase CheD [Clostridium butyricum E4 str. BoNT E BL5262]NFL31573.1 chemotaxis protein CheD [Clostridium butyricum]NFS18160.1 chemotaxis protein CheD [Clostridium butyricum]